MAERLPDFIIIGAMKCGTSTLHEQLGLRSGLFLSDPKEPNFFSDDHHFARGLGSYSALFQEARAEQRCGESSTHYTKLPEHPHTVARMAEHLPRCRFLYVMRHPIDRLVSQYIHEWSQRECRGSLTQAVREHERFLAYSCYARQLRPFREQWGESSILPVFFENMLADPDGTLQRICRFVEDPSPEPVGWVPDVSPQNVSSQRLRRSPAREWLLGLPGMQALKNVLPTGAKERLKGLWRMRRRPEVTPALRQELEEVLDEDLQVLGGWLGMSLTCRTWKDEVRGTVPAWKQGASS